jgi:polyhydroxyalkanoate synthesis regulator phasin
VATKFILEETLKRIKNEKSELEKTYEQRIVNLMREMDNSVKLYAELSTSDSKFRTTKIILEKRVIDLEVFPPE